MKREKFKDFLNRVNKEEFLDYYKNHSNTDTALFFNTNSGKVTQLARYYGYTKNLEDIQRTKENTCYNKYGVSNPSKNIEIINKIKKNRDNNKVSVSLKETNTKKFQDLLYSLPSRDVLYNEYIIQDLSREQIRDKYNLSDWQIDKIINHYKINKSKNQSIKKGIITKYLKYGGKDSYNQYVRNKTIQTIEASGKTLEQFYKEIGEKCSKAISNKTVEEKRIITEKTRQTCLEKYGYDFACMRPEARSVASDSKPNLYFKKLLEDNNIEFEREFPIGRYSYDFKVGDILIEVNPFPTHNSTFGIFGENPKSKNYHYTKSVLAKDNGFRCIHIWDWDDLDKIILLLKPRERIFARNCSIKEVSKEDSKLFINKYHLQGYAKDNIRIGLYYKDSLVSVMTFGKPRYNKKYEYELIRYCSSYNVVGGAEKLFSYFIKNYSPKSIISYCDLSKFNGDIYLKLGFIYKGYSISKHWFNGEKHITDNLLRQRGFDQLFEENYGKGTSNEELMLNIGFVEIYDAGQAVYEYLECDT